MGLLFPGPFLSLSLCGLSFSFKDFGCHQRTCPPLWPWAPYCHIHFSSVVFCFLEKCILSPIQSQVLPSSEASLGSSILPATILFPFPHDGLWHCLNFLINHSVPQTGFLLALHVMKTTLVKDTIDFHDAKSNRRLCLFILFQSLINIQHSWLLCFSGCICLCLQCYCPSYPCLLPWPLCPFSIFLLRRRLFFFCNLNDGNPPLHMYPSPGITYDLMVLITWQNFWVYIFISEYKIICDIYKEKCKGIPSSDFK